MSNNDYFNYNPNEDHTTSENHKSDTESRPTSRSSSIGFSSNVTNLQPLNRNSSGPKSPGISGTHSFIRSPNATAILHGEHYFHRVQSNSPQILQSQQTAQTQHFSASGSAGSSTRSSRRPSFISSMNGLNIEGQKPNNQQLAQVTQYKSNTSISSKSTIRANSSIVLSPEMASTHTLNSSNISTPQGGSNSKHTGNVPDTSRSNSTSSRSFSKSNSSFSTRSFKRQYILNEQLYLEKLKNKVHDDYYTRGIIASSANDDDDPDIGMDDVFDDFGFNSNTSAIINGGQQEPSNTNTFNPNTNYSPENLVAMSSGFIFHKLDWLRSAEEERKQGEKFDTDSNNRSIVENDNTSNQKFDAAIEQLFQNPKVMERFEWQTMLTNVIEGDIVRSEKTKIAKDSQGLNKEFADNFWLELKAWMNGRTVEDQKKSLNLLKASTDSFFQEVMEFKVEEGLDSDEAEEMVKKLLDKYFKVVNFWPNLKRMHSEKAITSNPEFIYRIDAMISWLNIKNHFALETSRLAEWVGVNDFFDECDDKEVHEDIRTFAEQIMKEKDIETIFQKKIFFPLAPWILKAKVFYMEFQDTTSQLNLQYSSKELEALLLFPLRLVKSIITIRIAYAKKIQNPTMMMIDQMIDDFSSYIRLSIQLKFTLKEYCIGWPFQVDMGASFDNVVIDAIRYLFILIQLKILDGTTRMFKSFKEPEVLLKYWDELKNVGYYIDGASVVVANGFTKLTLRVLHRLHSYLLQQQNSPQQLKDAKDAEKWIIQIFENFGSKKRKLNRFTNLLTQAFENSATYNIEDHRELFYQLKETDHFLIRANGDLEANGIYLIGSPELLGLTDREILRIIESSTVGCDLVPKLDIRNSLTIYNAFDIQNDPNSTIVQNSNPDGVPYHTVQFELNGGGHHRNTLHNNFRNNSLYKTTTNHNDYNVNYSDYLDTEREYMELELKLQSLGYLLIITPSEPIVWEGKMYNLSEDTIIQYDSFCTKDPKNSITLIVQESSYSLEYLSERFQQIAGDSVSLLSKKCLVESVESTLQRINKAYFGFTYSVLNDYAKIISTFQKVCPSSDILNGIFLFTRDFGRNFLRTNVANNEKKSLIILLMSKVSIAWLSFLSEECDPTDPRTFRWCVTAMEFAMQMTRGWNVLALDEQQFKELKQKISACMSLLISHFDVMGARAFEIEKTNQQARMNLDIVDDFDVDAALSVNSELRMRKIVELEETVTRNPHQIGKVLDDRDQGNKYLLSLASSLSNVSMRWQKRKFVGGGTFGTVFSAVNLDNGEILAVKEIKIQDSKSMEKIFPSLKEEMSVLEMLNHPNIVQYYGVEVHRDKVNIFMEYCEGGTLSSLLEHGRIEDEMVTQIYTLELLEGLAYLHESGIVHRDIKPENILLDFNGIIKYVDFGAARKIAKKGTMLHAASKLGDQKESNLQDMIGTPMYMAPESITGSKHKGSLGSDDIWSIGCVVLEMITGRRPWANLDNEWAIMYHVAAGQIPQLPTKDEVSEMGRRFLERCLVQDPTHRATAVELLMDPWIVEIRELAFGNPEEGSVISSNTDDSQKTEINGNELNSTEVS